MNGGRHIGLWTAAMAGSLALHGAVGMALIAMPMPEARPKVETEITIETLAEGSVTTTAPVVAANVATASPALAVAPSETTLVAAVTASTPVEAATGPALEPVAAPQALAPSATAATIVAATAEPTNAAGPEAVSPALAPVVSEETVSIPMQAEAVASPQAADSQSPALAIEDFASLEAVESLPAPAPSGASASLLATSASAAVSEALVPATSAVAARPIESAATSVVTSQTATVAPAAVAAQSAPAPKAAAAVAEPSQLSHQSAPTVAQRAPVPAAVAAPAGTKGVASANSVVAPVTSRVVAGTSTTPAPVQAQEVVVAMLPRPEVGPAEQGDTATTAAQLASFLDTHETGGCVLAVPSVAQDGEATIDGFSVEDAEVDRIGQAFQRQSGLAIRTHTRHVTAGQCSALAFSRALPQYPNYPLSLRLEAPSIESGAVLSGEVSGLRKPYLYLVVIDDEGKAKLINTFEGMTRTSVAFSAPMTLTAGPVASVQLLVAVASDDPLTTIATRDGVSAQQFFDGVASEIVNQNRSIHYGITSFTVQ